MYIVKRSPPDSVNVATNVALVPEAADSFLTFARTGNADSISYDFSVDGLPPLGNATLYYWAFSFTLSDGKTGYIGFQNNGNLVTQNRVGGVVNFAVWNTAGGTAGPNGEIANFSHEGSGVRAPSRYPFEANHTYTVTLQAAGGNLTATVTDTATHVSTTIGTIHIGSGVRLALTNAGTFSETFGQPFSAGYISPITAAFSNFKADGVADPIVANYVWCSDNFIQNGTEYVFSLSNGELQHFTGGPGGNTIFASDNADTLWLGPKNETIQCGAGNDLVCVSTGSASIDGGSGIDTVRFAVKAADARVTQTSIGYTVAISGTTTTLSAVERLAFSDSKLAFDLDGHAGQVAKILGAVFGAQSLSNKTYVGIGLGLLESGTSYSDLAKLAIEAAGAHTSTQIVNLLWTNVVGSAPTAAQAKPYVDLLNAGMKIGDLGVLAADTSLNQDQIHLVGLSTSGLPYL